MDGANGSVICTEEVVGQRLEDWQQLRRRLCHGEEMQMPRLHLFDANAAFASLLRSIDQNSHQLVADISSKNYLAMSQLPLSYPWTRLVFDFKDLHAAWNRHIITCLIQTMCHIVGASPFLVRKVPETFRKGTLQ